MANPLTALRNALQPFVATAGHVRRVRGSIYDSHWVHFSVAQTMRNKYSTFFHISTRTRVVTLMAIFACQNWRSKLTLNILMQRIIAFLKCFQYLTLDTTLKLHPYSLLWNAEFPFGTGIVIHKHLLLPNDGFSRRNNCILAHQIRVQLHVIRWTHQV